MSKIGRNDPCPCGSGKKYKRCCYRSAIVSRQLTPHNFASLDDVLNSFSSGEVPDYGGFQRWFQQEWERRRAAGALDSPPVDFPTQAVERLTVLVQKENR